ncbi:hypothetical protein JM93_03609 [Roseibium hamelinense]|uniref:Uncharacterized protein n=1 Tax=Roseibium hamelinense TaxID=150831 RepID=A0A562SNK9_9HYPH|nr:hypothetical protein JM93_03609 [Roseibium hamelinense]
MLALDVCALQCELIAARKDLSLSAALLGRFLPRLGPPRKSAAFFLDMKQ